MTCRFRLRPFASVALLASLALSALPALMPAAALAAQLPPIRTSASNPVEECVTPGRLMAFLRERNPKLDPRYDQLASHYMRYGQALGVRWDYAFFQMILETGYLTYTGAVKPDQNNFAGLGSTGKGVRGERFADVSLGVRAHLEHIVMYSGERVENPVAERTRDIQSWGILTSWQKGFSRPITYADLAKKWAPGSRRYARDIQAIAARFFEGACRAPDPYPQLMAEIRGTEEQATRPSGTPPAPGDTPAKADTAPHMKEQAAAPPPKNEAAADKETKTPEVKTASMGASVTLLNSAKSEEAAVASETAVSNAAADQGQGGAIEMAALGAAGQAGAATQPENDGPAAGPKGECRVWTASYGGTKAIIIKAVQDTTTNYTVLDVHEGSEKREADAYINAYAKGGKPVGEFASPSQALEKAFELCPEG